jgi:hypothetical protein
MSAKHLSEGDRPNMPTRKLPVALGLVLSAVCFAPRPSVAQLPIEPAQLPARTVFYLLWRGTPSGEVRRNNALFALWDDPEFASARTSFVETVLSHPENQQSQKDKPKVSREELAQYATLLDNSFLLGYIQKPPAPTAPKDSASKESAAKDTTPKTPPAWNGGFFIYDCTGKEDLLSKAVLRVRGSESDVPKLSQITVAGVSALKVERKTGVTYWAENGKYAASANELPVFEEILNRLNGKATGSSLSQSEAFQEAKALFAGGVLEFFLGLSNASGLAADLPNNPVVPLKPFLGALKLDAIHSIAGHLSLEGSKTRMTASLLGDTTSGGLFDLWADGQANPASLSMVTSDTVYYSESQFDLLGIYRTLKRALSQLSGNTSNAPNPLENMAETRLGMPVPDALATVTGEFASLQNSPALDTTQRIYWLGIRNKPDALKLARTVLGDRISSERNEGDAAFLKVSLGGAQSSAGVTQWNFYYLAMTPSFLLGAGKSETLHAYLQQAASNSTSALPKNISAFRGQYPEKLNGFSYFDFQKLDWPAVKAKWIAESNKSAKAAKSNEAAESNQKFTDWLSQVNPEVFPRHLHSLIGASWKDAKGVHFDERLD